MYGTIVLIVAVCFVVSGIIWFIYASRQPKKAKEAKETADKGAYAYTIRMNEQEKTLNVYNFRYAGIAISGIWVILLASTLIYFQDPGEVSVVKNLGGSLSGSSDEAGIHLKAPWQDIVQYDIRNNTISFIGESEEDYVGGRALGPAITINDRGGASADMDVQVQYSLQSDAAIELYVKYGSQENFVRQVIAVGIRAHSRDVAGKIDTIDILTSRGAFSELLMAALAEAWADDGVIVEGVSVQDIRYPDSIKDSYATAQAAAIAKARAENEQETARVEAETKLIIAQGEANANQALQESLTPDIISMRYIDAMESIGAKGNLIVISNGDTMPMINLPS